MNVLWSKCVKISSKYLFKGLKIFSKWLWMSSDRHVVLHSFPYEVLLFITLLLEYSLVSTQRQCPEMYVRWLHWLWFLLHPELWAAAWLGQSPRSALYCSLTPFPHPCWVVVPLAKTPVKEPLRACVQPSMLVVNWWGWRDERTAEHVVSQTRA